MKLSELVAAFNQCETVATPHRTPNFKAMFEKLGGDANVTGTCVFIEEHNTGYDGILERWIMFAESEKGKVRFQIDLLPNQVSSR